MALAMMSCSKDDMSPGRGIDYEYGRHITHEEIVLGDRLENPYKTDNISRALSALYPSKAGRIELETTDLYVRFLPQNDAEFDLLDSLGIDLIDHPLDYDIIVDGDWYHDPEVPDDRITWQYAVVPEDFSFPDITYEIIDECYLSENDAASRAFPDIDWEAVERQSYILTGNEDLLDEGAGSKASKVAPSGRITIVDDKANGGKPFGVAGVRVSCNSFVKFDHAYTDRDGYYSMKTRYSSKIRYRLVFKNEKGFAIGFNLILVPGSVSTLGKASCSGVDITITRKSESKLFRRCAVNNAVYDYIVRCGKSDMNIAAPPSDLRIWIINGMEASSAVMLHHGTVLGMNALKSFLGEFSSLIAYFLPDITIGMKGKDDYRSIYSTVCHELAHASHFAKVGKDYWDKYIVYIIESYLTTGGMTYGDGTGSNAGYCEIGESWAYYLESKMYKERYGGSFPTFGTSFWFYPQIFRYMDERGMKRSEIFAALDKNTVDRSSLKSALTRLYPGRRSIFEQAFSRYGK